MRTTHRFDPVRREFLAVSLATTAAAPLILGAGRLRAPLTVGTGDHQYEVQHDWLMPPSDIAWGNTHGICQDSQGRFYVKHTIHASSARREAVVVFDDKGKYIGAWGSELGIADGAHGLHLSAEGGREYLYLCDHAQGVVFKTDLDGEVVWKRGVPEECGHYAAAHEYHPTNVAIAPGGEVYVADGYGKGWIHQYTLEGAYVRTFGGPGSEKGKLNCPHGLMIDTRGGSPVLVIADRANHRIQTFALDGTPRDIYTGNVKLPCHFHARGGVLLVPDLDARVTLLDADNALIAHLGEGAGQGLRDKPRDQFVPGQFITPHSAIFDHDGNIIVVEWVDVGRVTRLRKV